MVVAGSKRSTGEMFFHTACKLNSSHSLEARDLEDITAKDMLRHAHVHPEGAAAAPGVAVRSMPRQRFGFD